MSGIYQPKGRAKEYCDNAVNLYLGCCFAFVESMADFLYCQTSLCMAWETAKGGCLMLFSGGCDCNENKTACGKE